jgi:hypothetical protein
MRLRSILRHVESLPMQSAQNQNRLHTAYGYIFHTRLPCSRFEALVASLELRIHKLRDEAMTHVRLQCLYANYYESLILISLNRRERIPDSGYSEKREDSLDCQSKISPQI